MSVTIENFQEHFPVGGDADVFFIDMVVQKHSARVLPRLFPETNPEDNSLLNKYCFYILFFSDDLHLLKLIRDKKSLPVDVKVELALLPQLGKQLLFGLPHSHAFSKHSVHKELAGL